MKLMIMMSIIISIMFLFTKHPMSMGFNLLMQTLFISLITGILSINFWYSYMLFIVMVGGMLVLFIYMTCVASNEKFSMPKMTITVLIIGMVNIITYKSNLTSLVSEMKISQWNQSLVKFFLFPQGTISLLMMIYLFLALIAVVKITKIEMGPLRSKM
uniref:NADH dehydrogenase subunit 6 n=1 Tax=Sambus kanssuensis TaxID=3045898 RepID=UPI0025798FB1|nr:NADH dehydrogenase subunit 6 [Sambus kanssuensis]WHE42544.1 NADH dehydrogenase subunit 6 [Sambus kanssuensis]